MLKVGDTVKVIAATEDAGYCDGRKIEYIPIGSEQSARLQKTKLKMMDHSLVQWIPGMDMLFGIKKTSLKKDIWNG